MDTRAIKVSIQGYNELDRYRGKGETFSDALRKVLDCAEFVRAGAAALGPVGWFDIKEPRSTDPALQELLDRRREELQLARGSEEVDT